MTDRNPFEKVTPNQPLAIPALEYNAFIDAALADRARRGRTGGGPVTAGTDRNACVVTVKNATGADVPRFGILALTDPIITAAANETEFKRETNFIGTAWGPSSTQFAVTLEPLAANAIGTAVLIGVVPCRVDVQSAADDTCGPVSGETDRLASGSGNARIVWKEAGTGERWAYVLLNGGADGGQVTDSTGYRANPIPLDPLVPGTGSITHDEMVIDPTPGFQLWEAPVSDLVPTPSGKAYLTMRPAASTLVPPHTFNNGYVVAGGQTFYGSKGIVGDLLLVSPGGGSGGSILFGNQGRYPADYQGGVFPGAVLLTGTGSACQVSLFDNTILPGGTDSVGLVGVTRHSGQAIVTPILVPPYGQWVTRDATWRLYPSEAFVGTCYVALRVNSGDNHLPPPMTIEPTASLELKTVWNRVIVSLENFGIVTTLNTAGANGVGVTGSVGGVRCIGGWVVGASAGGFGVTGVFP